VIGRRVVVAFTIIASALVLAPELAGAADSTSTPTAAITPTGNVQPALDAVTGKVAVAASGAPVDDQVAVIVANGTTRAARVELITATATTGGGATAVRARTVSTYPTVIGPGAYALAVVKFRKNTVPLDATMTFRVRSTRAKSAADPRALAVSNLVLSPPLTGAVAQTLGARVTNPSTTRTARLPRVAAMCFNEASKPVTMTTARLDVAKLAPAKAAPASVPLTLLCPTYLVAASSA
jgi:hypothetical protein